MPGPEGKDPLEEKIRRMTVEDIDGMEGLSDKEKQALILRYGIKSSPETPLHFKGENAVVSGHPEIEEILKAMERGCAGALEQSGAIVVENGGIRKARPEEMN